MAYKIKNVWTGDEYKDAYLSEKEVRELASQLPKEVFLGVAREQLGLEYIENMIEEDTEPEAELDCGCRLVNKENITQRIPCGSHTPDHTHEWRVDREDNLVKISCTVCDREFCFPVVIDKDAEPDKELIGELEGFRPYSTENMEQQRVSDCLCGGEVSGLNPNKCVAGKENCDAVEPDDKIDREGVLDMLKYLRSDMASDYLGEDVTLSNFLQQTEKFNKKFTKLNDIIEKINND